MELAAEVGGAPADVRDFIAEQVEEPLSNESFVDSLAGHLAGDPAGQAIWASSPARSTFGVQCAIYRSL